MGATIDEQDTNLRQLSAKNLARVKKIEISQIEDLDLLKLSAFANLEELIIFDKLKYKLLYDLYFIGWKLSENRSDLDYINFEKIKLKSRSLWREQERFIKLLEQLKLYELRKHLELRRNLKDYKSSILRWRLEWGKWCRQRIEEQKLELQKLRKRLNKESESRRMDLLSQQYKVLYLGEMIKLKQIFTKDKNEFLKLLQPIEDFLKDMKLLQEKLPNCKMIF